MKAKLNLPWFFFILFFGFSINTFASEAPPCNITGPNQVCSNLSANYQVDVNNASYTYQWVVTGGSMLSQTNNTCAVQWNVPGTGSIAVNITQNGTLINSCSLAVTVFNTPSPSIIPSFEATCFEEEDPGGEQRAVRNVAREKAEDPCSKVCENSKVVYRTPFHAGSSYTWLINGLSYTSTGGQGTNIFTVTWGSISTGTIQVTETNAAGCSKTVYKCIQIIKTPIANFATTPAHNGGSVTICKSQTVSFKDISVAASNSPIVSWVWDFGDGSGTATYTAGATVTHQYNTGGMTYLATLTVKNACGCENTFSIRVIVQKFDVPQLVCPSTVCCGKATVYSITHAQDEEVGCGYRWSVTGGILLSPNPGQTADNAIIEWDCSPTPKTIILTPVGCNRCDAPINYDVAVITTLATIYGNTIVCPSSEETYSIPAMPGCNFVWSLSDPSAGEVFAGAETNSVKVRWSSGFNGTVFLNVSYINTVFGCGGTGQLGIILRPAFEVIANPGGPICAGNSVTFTAINQLNGLVNTSWKINQLPSGTNIFSVTGPVSSISYTFSSGGDYEIVATDNAATTCNGPAKLVKTITAIPPIHTGTVNGQVTNICPGQSYMYTATPTSDEYSLLWDASPNGTVTPISGNKVNIVWTASGVIKIYQVNRTNPACSSIVRIINVVATAPPACNITSSTGNFSACANGTVTYSAAAGFNNYNWSINPSSAGSIISGQGTSSVTVQWHNTNAATTATLNVGIQYCVQSTQNCTSPVITILPTPTFGITPANASICLGTAQIFNVTLMSAGLITWHWGDGSSTSSIGLSASHSYSSAGTFNITAVVQQPNGCTAATLNTSTSVNILNVPKVLISLGGSGKTILCPGEPTNSPIATLNATLYGAPPCSGVITYTWFRNNSQVATGANATYQPTTWPALGGTDFYYVRYSCTSTPCGTVNSPSVAISRPFNCVVPPTCTLAGTFTPTFTWTQTSSSACGSGTLNYTAPAPGFATKIDFDDQTAPAVIANQNSGSVSHTYGNPGIYRPVLYTKYPSTTAGVFCEVLKSVEVTIPVIAKIMLSPLCNAGGGYNIIVSDNSDKLGVYATGTRRCNLDGGAWQTMTSNSFTFFGIAGGNHTVTFEITVTRTGFPSYTCSVTKPLVLTVLTPPTISIGPGIPRCVGAPVVLSSSIVNAAGYLWQFGDNTSSLLAQPTHEYKNSFSPVAISVQVTTIEGCVVSGSTTLNVVANNLAVNITSPGGLSPVAICQGGTGPLLISNVTGATNPVSYSWNTSTANNISTNASVAASNQESNRYTVKVTDAIGCVRTSAPFEVIVKPTPVASIIGRDEYCQFETISLSAQQNAGYTYQWTVNNINYGTNPSITITNPNVGNNTVKLVVSAGGCTATTTIIVRVNSNPYVYVTPGINSQLCAGQPNVITANIVPGYGTPPYSYYWNTVPVQTAQSITVTNAGLYQATVIDINGCKGSDITRVYRAEDFTNFMSGCYEFCNDKRIELVGPKSPSIANSPLPPYGIPYLITYYYQWFKDGNPIPAPEGINANYWVDPSPGPYSGSGQYTLSVTSTLPSAGCEKNSLTDFEKSFNVTFKECCKVEMKILDIICIRGTFDPQRYLVTLQVYNPYPGSATLTLHSPSGPVYTIPAGGNLPNPGWNTITAYFDNMMGSTELCIDGGTVIDDKTLESCDFETDRCIKLPECRELCGTENPCTCFSSDPVHDLVCSQSPPIPGYAYAYDLKITFMAVCHPAQAVIYSECGKFVPTSSMILSNAPDLTVLTGTFYTNQPPGTSCQFLVLIIDLETGKELCHFCFDYELANCFGKGAVVVNKLTGTAGDPVVAKTAGIAKPNSIANKIVKGKAENQSSILGKGLLVIPNPASGFAKLNYKFNDESNNSVVVYNMVGTPVKTYTGLSQAGAINIDVNALAGGTYVVKGFGKGAVLITKLIVQH
jgi:PKD repeat protein